MNEELDKELCKKYPKIFADRSGKPNETAMCWGFSCGDGWYNIIDALCQSIQSEIDVSYSNRENAIKFNNMVSSDEPWPWDNIPREFRDVPDVIDQVVAIQVKEKFGGLRFYVNRGTDAIYALINMAEVLSLKTCEVCGGKPGGESNKGWLKTTCKKHK